MTRDETKTILAMMSTVYPLHLMAAVTEMTVNVWAQMLGDLDYRAVQAAVAAWITTEHYPPTIADIRERVVASRLPDTTPDQAWGLVKRAVALYGERKKDAEAWLPAEVWAVCAQRGWRYYCEMDEREEGTNYAQFRDAYRSQADRAKRQAQIPAAVRATLARIGATHGEVDT